MNPYLAGILIGMATAMAITFGPLIILRLYRGSIFYRRRSR